MPPKIASPTPKRAEVDAENLVPHEHAAVETFQFEVSAGEKLTPAGEQNRVSLRVDRPLAIPQVELQPAKIPHVARARPAKIVKSISPARAWLMSLLVNGGILGGMALVRITGLSQGFDFALSFSAEPSFADEAVMDDIAIDPLEHLETAENQLATEQAAISESELTDASLADFASASLADGALSDASELFAAPAGSLAEVVPSGEKLTASFFGTKVDGRRILYILDNSGGMKNGQLEALIDELLKSVESLSSQQQFYVIFYSDMLYPLFHPQQVDRFVPANDRFKKRLKAWLDSVEFATGNTVDEAIQAAANIRPDAVYLLTDGDVDTTRDGRKLAALTDSSGRDFPIHTFGIGMRESSKAADNLRLVAEANNGTFRAVEVSDEAEQLAKQKNRPYHNKEPGREWGLNVGRGWGR